MRILLYVEPISTNRKEGVTAIHVFLSTGCGQQLIFVFLNTDIRL